MPIQVSVTNDQVSIKTTEGDQDRTELIAARANNPLSTKTAAELDQWIVTNVTDLASAKVALRYIVRAMRELYVRNARLETIVSELLAKKG